jgi:hypothetical protein
MTTRARNPRLRVPSCCHTTVVFTNYHKDGNCVLETATLEGQQFHCFIGERRERDKGTKGDKKRKALL